MIEIPEQTRRDWYRRSFAERSHPPSPPRPKRFTLRWWPWQLSRLIGEAP